MSRLRLVETQSGRCLMEDVTPAVRVMQRFLGLMGRSTLAPGTGMYFPRCSSIHMFFMRFPIDAVYLDKAGRVRKIVRGLKPWRLSWCPGGDSVLEAPAGWAQQVGLDVGMQVAFEETAEARR